MLGYVSVKILRVCVQTISNIKCHGMYIPSFTQVFLSVLETSFRLHKYKEKWQPLVSFLYL